VALDDPTSPTPRFTYDPSDAGPRDRLVAVKPGEGGAVSQMPNPAVNFVFGLVVSDGDLQSAQSQVQVSLTVNDPPDADAGIDQTLETPEDGCDGGQSDILI